MTDTWQPLLDGELADRAWEAIHAIAADIGSPPDPGSEEDPTNWGLAGGAAGTALFLAYLAEATDDETAGGLACEHLEASLEGVARQPLSVGLWGGILGVTWSYDHLAGWTFEDDESEEASDADELLTRFLTGAGAVEGYDLIDGLAGFGVACLEGLPRPGARRGLYLVLDHLLGTAEHLETGIRWLTPPELLPEWQRRQAPEGYYNLGVAHGMPAVVTLLARCIGAGIRAEELEPVLDGAVRWLLSQERPYPSWIARGGEASRESRLAWCYGEPGVAGALLAAGRATGNERWQARAAEIGREAAERDPATSGVRDAGLCHGAAGLAHIFNRMYQATGSERMAHAARYWLEDTLDWRRNGRGVGGYQAWALPRGKMRDAAASGAEDLDWVDDPGLLTGAAGVGLCLLAAVGDRDPEWDRSLLLS